MHKILFFTLLTFMVTISTVQTWASYEPWGWGGPSDRQIEQIRTHCAGKTEQESYSFLTIIEQFIIKNAVISQEQPELEDEQFLKSFIGDTVATKIDFSNNQKTKSAVKQDLKTK